MRKAALVVLTIILSAGGLYLYIFEYFEFALNIAKDLFGHEGVLGDEEFAYSMIGIAFAPAVVFAALLKAFELTVGRRKKVG